MHGPSLGTRSTLRCHTSRGGVALVGSDGPKNSTHTEASMKTKYVDEQSILKI